jgi:hypothetical protein
LPLTWIACLAILFSALAPSISAARAAANASAPWAEVCSAKTGVDNGGRQHPGMPGHANGHCPFCSLHAPALPLPEVEATTPLRIALRVRVSPPSTAPRPRDEPRRPAQPGAPPSMS